MNNSEDLAADANRQLQLGQFAVATPDAAALRAHRIVGFDNRDIRVRPFNLARTSLAKQAKEDRARLIGITSATPAAGKSFLSLNLAAALARVADEAVYLVDLDLRRASVAEELGLEVSAGVDGYLDGSVSSLREIGRLIEGTRLAVFPTRTCRKSTAELLAGPRFAEMVEELKNNADGATVLFDLPPAFASDDAMISLEQLDGYILVIDCGKTTKKQVKDVVALLEPARCLGTMLNRYRGGFADPYGYGYGPSEYERYYT